jgi:hypothetical protein
MLPENVGRIWATFNKLPRNQTSFPPKNSAVPLAFALFRATEWRHLYQSSIYSIRNQDVTPTGVLMAGVVSSGYKDFAPTGLFNLGDFLVPKLRTRQRWNGRATVPTKRVADYDKKSAEGYRLPPADLNLLTIALYEL